MTTPCPVYKENVGPAQKCPHCSKNIRVICGKGTGDEEYGQNTICPDCDSKATGAVAAGAAATAISPTSEKCSPQPSHRPQCVPIVKTIDTIRV